MGRKDSAIAKAFLTDIIPIAGTINETQPSL